MRRASEKCCGCQVVEPSYVEGGLGWKVWPAAECLCRWLVTSREQAITQHWLPNDRLSQVAHQDVVELAAGLGAPGLVAGLLGARHVMEKLHNRLA